MLYDCFHSRGLQGVTTTIHPAFDLADIAEVVCECTEQSHGLNITLTVTRDQSGGLHPLPGCTERWYPHTLTPNCRWSDPCGADAEWRLDKRNHPDGRGWSGWWLAAAQAPQLGPQCWRPSGGRLATGHHWLTGPDWTDRGWVVGCWFGEGAGSGGKCCEVKGRI